jgi:hypothetical protein
MSQVLSGHRFGNGFSLLFGSSDPNSASAPVDIQSGQIDYMYIRLGTGSANTWLYRCSTGAVITNGVVTTPAVWTAK